jgi:hypothetical protein
MLFEESFYGPRQIGESGSLTILWVESFSTTFLGGIGKGERFAACIVVFDEEI